MYDQPRPQPNPAMMEMRARLRPMGIGDILDETFRLYRANFLLFLATVAVVEIPLQIIVLALTLSLVGSIQSLSTLSSVTTSGEPLTSSQRDTLIHSVAASSGLAGLVSLISIIALALVSTALALVISRRYLDRAVTVGEAYRASLNRIGSFLLATIWIGIRVLLMAITIIGIPFAIYFGVAWTLFPQAIILDGVDGGAASRRSRELISGFWWKTFGLLIVTQLLITIVSSIPTAIVTAAIGNTVGALYTRTVVSGIIGLIVGLLLRPIQATATTLLFYDLKIRKEAFDLEAMTQQAAAPPPFGQPNQPHQPFGQPTQPYGQPTQLGQSYQPYGQPDQPGQSYGQPNQPDQPYSQQDQPSQQGQPDQPRRPDHL